MGAAASHQCVIFDGLMDSNSLFLTGNTDTVYAALMFDLERDGATVVEIPPGCGPGTVDDAWFRFVIDMGSPGPDRGQGGKYLLLPPGYDGEVPDGYFTATSTSYTNLLLLRGFLVDGKPDAASAMFREGLRVYPLSQADNPPAMEFISGTGRSFNTVHSNDFSFYEELHAVIDREPIELIDPETRGLFTSIGIRQGTAVRTRSAHDRPPRRSGRGGQRDRADALVPAASRRAPTSTTTAATGRTGSSAATIAG